MKTLKRLHSLSGCVNESLVWRVLLFGLILGWGLGSMDWFSICIFNHMLKVVSIPPMENGSALIFRPWFSESAYFVWFFKSG